MIRPPREAGRTGWDELLRHPRLGLGMARGAVRTVIQELGWRRRSLRDPAAGWGSSFAEALERRARARPDAPLLYAGGRVHTAAECDRGVNRFAHLLRESGIGPGSTVALLMKNHSFYIEAYLALQRLGAVSVRTNTGLVDAGLHRVLSQSAVEMLVVDREFLNRIRPLLDRLPDLRRILVHDDGSPFDLPDPRVLDIVPEVLDSMPASKPVGRHLSDAVLEIKFTSGTTGAPKGVLVRRSAPAYRFLPFYANFVYRPNDVIFTCLPLFHDIAMMMAFGSALWCGATFALAPRFSARRFWKQVTESKTTTFHATGSMIAILLRLPQQQLERQHCVRMVLGSACPKHLWRHFEERFGVSLWEGYGASDGAGFGVLNHGNAPVGSVGRPFLRHALVDEDDRPVAEGTVGELIFYTGEGAAAECRVEFLADESTAPSKVRDGWLRTGDRMCADARGYLFFAGRVSDSMRCHGENVSAYEVETVVIGHAAVQECAAYPVPSDLAGDEIMIAVVQSPGQSVAPNELYEFLCRRLSRHAWPRYIRLLEALPRTRMEKVNRQELIEAGVTRDCFEAQRENQQTSCQTGVQP